MATGNGLTEVPDSEEEPLTSSPEGLVHERPAVTTAEPLRNVPPGASSSLDCSTEIPGNDVAKHNKSLRIDKQRVALSEAESVENRAQANPQTKAQEIANELNTTYHDDSPFANARDSYMQQSDTPMVQVSVQLSSEKQKQTAGQTPDDGENNLTTLTKGSSVHLHDKTTATAAGSTLFTDASWCARQPLANADAVPLTEIGQQSPSLKGDATEFADSTTEPAVSSTENSSSTATNLAIMTTESQPKPSRSDDALHSQLDSKSLTTDQECPPEDTDDTSSITPRDVSFPSKKCPPISVSALPAGQAEEPAVFDIGQASKVPDPVAIERPEQSAAVPAVDTQSPGYANVVTQQQLGAQDIPGRLREGQNEKENIHNGKELTPSGETNSAHQPSTKTPLSTLSLNEATRLTPAKSAQENILAELKVQRAALLASLAVLPAIRELVAESGDSDAEPSESEVMAAAHKISKKHIKLLHEYNEIKDIGQGLMGLLADQRGVRIVEVQDEFGIGPQD